MRFKSPSASAEGDFLPSPSFPARHKMAQTRDSGGIGMERKLHFCLVGGDRRQQYLAEQLTADRHTVHTAALSNSVDLSALQQGDCVVLPMPPSDSTGMLHAPMISEKIPICTVLATLHPEQYIFAGKVPPILHRQAAEFGLTIHDYLLRDELAIANAVPTAEGALQLAMEVLPSTIHKSRVLVVGFGRVGQCTAARFHALGAEVTVVARHAGQLALSESIGCSPLPLRLLGQTGEHWDLIINTVPSPVLGQEQLVGAGQPVLMELASPPGGFDMEWVEASGLRHIPAPGLPGKVAPAAAARAIRTTLFAMLEELGV